MTSPRFRIKVFIFPQKTLSVLFCLFHPMAKSKWKKALLILPAATRDFNKVTFAVPRPFPTKSLASFLPKSFQHRPKEIWTLKSGPDESHSQCWMIIFAGWEQIRTNVRYPANRYCSQIKPAMQGGRLEPDLLPLASPPPPPHLKLPEKRRRRSAEIFWNLCFATWNWNWPKFEFQPAKNSELVIGGRMPSGC